jgi:hypothetical protein
MVPSACSRESRFCTVPRATCSVFASEATDSRALSRSRESSRRSIESIFESALIAAPAVADLYKTSKWSDYLFKIISLLVDFLAIYWLETP